MRNPVLYAGVLNAFWVAKQFSLQNMVPHTHSALLQAETSCRQMCRQQVQALHKLCTSKFCILGMFLKQNWTRDELPAAMLV